MEANPRIGSHDRERDEHWERRRAILREHPEIRELFGSDPQIAAIAFIVVIAQFALSAIAARQPWWIVLLLSFSVGAFCMHYLHVVIHECSHKLVLGSSRVDKICAIIANLPGVFPSAMAFRHYHLLHHRHLGRPGLDSDVAPQWVAFAIGFGRLSKLIWLAIQPFTYAVLHPLHVKERMPLDGWALANILLMLTADAAIVHGLGWTALGYLALSTYFAVGPHATGAHILQEHIIFDRHYDTASYYGPLNLISINHGLHVEHHDFPTIPGSRLGALRALAPSYYANRFSHPSRVGTLWQFVMDHRVGLASRVIRGPAAL
jgi:sphingolipid 4-desaturase/C4-monooxygenase